MTLPANDAFTLGLTGNHDSSRPSYPLSLRSTSPKIPFVSSSRSASKSSVKHFSASQPVPKSPIKKSMSNGSPVGPTKGAQYSRKTSTDSSPVARTPNGIASKKPPSAPVDWEIPRKTLHSSIGEQAHFRIMRPLVEAHVVSVRSRHTLSLYTIRSSPSRYYCPQCLLGFCSPC